MSNQTEQSEKSNEKARSKKQKTKNKNKIKQYTNIDINRSVKRGRRCKKRQSEA
jgi:hypothetical protein